jgi:hypothetical protein
MHSVDDQGLIYAPEKPVLGYEIDWELVRWETVYGVKLAGQRRSP